jgi:hypothetical protein
MIEYLSAIILKNPIPGTAIPVGSKGVVVMVYHNPSGYEVEFMDDEGDTLQDPNTKAFTFTLYDGDIELLPS